jgi:hypothetical protein
MGKDRAVEQKELPYLAESNASDRVSREDQVFNLLAYHVSSPPTAEEFGRLPPTVFYKWLSGVSKIKVDDLKKLGLRQEEAASHFANGYALGGIKQPILDELRKIIREYEPI